GTSMKRLPEECYDLIENMTAHHNDWDTSSQRSESSSSITSSSDTEIAALKAEMTKINKNFIHRWRYSKRLCCGSLSRTKTGIKDTIILKGTTREETNSYRELTKFMKMNTASSSGSRNLLSNTITNPKEDLKGITTRRGTAYPGPMIPTTSSFPVVERETETTKDTNFIEQTLLGGSLKEVARKTRRPVKFLIPYDFPRLAECLALVDLGASINLMPLSVWNKLSLPDLSPTYMTLELNNHIISRPVGVAEDVFVKVGPTILTTSSSLPKVVERETKVTKDTPVVAPLIKPVAAPVSALKPNPKPLIPYPDFLLEEVDAFLAFEDDLASPEVDQPYLDTEGYILLLEAFLNDDPSLPPPNQGNYMPKVRKKLKICEAKSDKYSIGEPPEGDILLLEVFMNDDPSLPPPNQGNYLPEVRKELKICEAKSGKSSIDEPPEVELKDLPPHIEYAILEGDDKLPVIILKDLSMEEKIALITVMKSHKRAIAWKLSNIKGIDPEFYTHKILMEEDFEPAVQHLRRVNLKIHDDIKQEVIKLLDGVLIYPISDSLWVSPVHCVPKKGGFTVVENMENGLILTRLIMGWHVCIDYRKLNEATRKEHFPLPFIDQMLERLAENQYYCFLDGFSCYF
nr:reverse transcriptase domain-containing protein [Tanacetum cinerariifolium]